LEYAVFDSFRRAELADITEPQLGPVQYDSEVTQGNRSRLFEAHQRAEAEELFRTANETALRRRAVAGTVAATVLVASGIVAGFTNLNRHGNSASEEAHEGPTTSFSSEPSSAAPSSSPTAESTPLPRYHVVPAVTLSLKPPRPTHKVPASKKPDTQNTVPPEPYVPSQTSYTPPASPVRHKPHLTVHHLKEH
jgi:hypothetical protein